MILTSLVWWASKLSCRINKTCSFFVDWDWCSLSAALYYSCWKHISIKLFSGNVYQVQFLTRTVRFILISDNWVLVQYNKQATMFHHSTGSLVSFAGCSYKNASIERADFSRNTERNVFLITNHVLTCDVYLTYNGMYCSFRVCPMTRQLMVQRKINNQILWSFIQVVRALRCDT